MIKMSPQFQQRHLFLVARAILKSFKIRLSTKDTLGNLLKYTMPVNWQLRLFARNFLRSLSTSQKGWVNIPIFIEGFTEFTYEKFIYIYILYVYVKASPPPLTKDLVPATSYMI